MSKHKHTFVPVDVTWMRYWHNIEPLPKHVVLACACGAVKLTKARIVGGRKE